MAVNLPLLNQAVWAPVLNAALAEVDARLADVEAAGRPVWHPVTAAPATSLGATGDFAINVSAGTGRGDVYQKTDDVTWVLVGNIGGPAGPQGLPGVNAVPADTAVGTYIATDGTATQAALTAAFVGRPMLAQDADGVYYPATPAGFTQDVDGTYYYAASNAVAVVHLDNDGTPYPVAL